MKIHTIVLPGLIAICTAQNITSRILAAAAADNIDLYSIPIANDALSSIQAVYDLRNVTIPAGISNGNKIDVHSHVVPPWYRALVPSTGQAPTPAWSLEAELDFLAGKGIRHAVLSISSPGSVVFPGGQAKSAALARLLNEYMAALVHKFPHIFSFFAVAPLPYTDSAITEATYALTHLHATGIGLQSNHEGIYLGSTAFKPFFAALNATAKRPPPIFVHPTGPCLRSPNTNGSLKLVSANPTVYPEGVVEFYFETARTFVDLTLTQTLVNFTALRWLVPHAGGAFPSTIDRFLTRQPAELQARSRAAFASRLWWDAAGPVFPRQVRGLLAFDVPVGRVVYGSDYPYAPANTFQYEIDAIGNATFLSDREKDGIFRKNSKALFE